MKSLLRMLAIGLLPSIALATDIFPSPGDSLFDRLMAGGSGLRLAQSATFSFFALAPLFHALNSRTLHDHVGKQFT